MAAQSRDILRFITCGSVDDGKSTLIGRLLHDSRQLAEDQMATLAADSRRLGEAIVSAIEKYDGTVAVLASGSLSHRFIDDQRAEEGMNSYTREFDRQMDERVVKLWREGQFKEFCSMLPEYADYCYGEGNMHDTVMLLGMLGWDNYDGKVEFLTELFASSGTGQVNAVFPLPA